MTPDEIKKKVKERAEREAAESKEASRRDEEITPEFILKCIQANEAGDGILYCALHRGKFVYNCSSDEWLLWTGHHWKLDKPQHALAAVEYVATRYLDEAANISREIERQKRDGNDDTRVLEKRRDDYFKRCSRMRTERGRQNCLKFARANLDGLFVEGEYLDNNPWLLPCKNGVVDLRTGAKRPGNPADYLVKASPHEWKGLDEPATLWEKFLMEVFCDREELVAFVQRLLGCAITGLSEEHIFAVFHGQGRNGKGLIVETIKYVMGNLVGFVQSEMLLDAGRNKSAAGPSPDIMALKGMRIAFGSETDQDRKFSPSRVKWLSGGDTLVGRNPHDKHNTEYLPTHTLFLLTNHKPHAPADDFAFWERILLIPFDLSFVDREPEAENERRADKKLRAKMQEESSGILAWLVRGCIAWQERGLDPPEDVTKATAEYQRGEDLIGDFVEQCLELGIEHETQASEVYHRFEIWWTLNVSKRVPKMRKFGTLLSKRFSKEKIGGVIKYIGFRLIPEPEPEEEPPPF